MNSKFKEAIDLHKNGQLEKAKNICLEILKSEPDNFNTLHLLGIIAFQTKNYKTSEEIHKYLKKVDGWDVKEDQLDGFYLIKEFKFKNFVESQNFVNKVGIIAEKEGHHPDIWFGWGYAKIKIFTHAIKGLHESDFVLAAKVDRIS